VADCGRSWGTEVRRKAAFVAEEVGAPMADANAGSRRVAIKRVFRKPSEIPPTQEPDFRGSPRCRLCGFQNRGDLLHCGRRGWAR
jgi:hypothetical protein